MKVFLSVKIFILVILLTGSFSFAAPLAEIRAAIHAKGHKWIAGDTSVSRLSDHEKKLRLGLIKAPGTGDEQVLSFQPPLTGLPSGLDWRSNGGNYVTPVRDQGSCGSCWAFATTAALESYILIKDNKSGINDDRAEEILLSCGGAGSCAGGYIGTASDYIRTTGLPYEPYFPYTATSADDTCSNAQAGWQSDAYKIFSWSYVTTASVSIDAIKSALAYGPLVTTMEVYDDFFSYSGGVYEHSTGNLAGGHAVLIVGYVDNASYNGGGYFMVKNSWGAGWGLSGYFNIAYSQISAPVYFGEFTIAYQNSAPPPPPPPTCTAVPLAATLVSPSGTLTTATTPIFNWNAVPCSSWYYLWANDAVGTRVQHWYTAADAGCASGTGICSVNPSVSLANGSGQWWIQTWDNAGYAPWSAAMNFTVNVGCTAPPSAATLVSPSGTLTTATPTYTWNAVPCSSWYYLWVNDAVGTRVQHWYTAADAGCASGTGICSVNPSVSLANGSGQWWIQTWDNAGYAPWSAAMNFRVGS